MTSSPVYWVEGIALVNCGGESCSACEKPAVGRSVSGHLICARHAGMAAVLAEEMAVEVEAAKARRAYERERVKAVIEEGNQRLASTPPPSTHSRRRGRPKNPTIQFRCGHSTDPSNVFTTPEGWSVCRQCKRDAQREARKKNRGRVRSKFYVSEP